MNRYGINTRKEVWETPADYHLEFTNLAYDQQHEHKKQQTQAEVNKFEQGRTVWRSLKSTGKYKITVEDKPKDNKVWKIVLTVCLILLISAAIAVPVVFLRSSAGVTVECNQSPPTITMDEALFESDLLKIVCVSNSHNMDEGDILLMEKKQNTPSFIDSTLIADVKTGGNDQGCQNTVKSFEFITTRDWNNTEFKCITRDNQQSETKHLIITGADFGIKVHFKNKTFTKEMTDTKSKAFQDFATQFEEELFTLLKATEFGENLEAVKVLSLKNGSITVEALLIFKTTTRVIIDDSNNMVTTDWTTVDILHEMQVIITTIKQQDRQTFPLFTQIEISVDVSVDIINEDIYSEYECQKTKTDIVFVLDKSGSVGPENYVKMKAFIANFTGNVLIRKDAALIGLVSFEFFSSTEFTLDDFQSPSQVIVAVNNITYTGGGTDIAGALAFADENSFSFSATNSHGRQNSTKVLVLMTDGHSGDASTQAQTLRDKGVLIICIGIGSGVDNYQLLAIADNETLVTHVSAFDALKTVVGLIQQSACNDASVTGSVTKAAVTTRAPRISTATTTRTTTLPIVTTLPTVTSRSPTVTTRSPTVTTRSPTVTTASPTVTTRSPTVTTAASTVTTRSPTVTTTLPTVTTRSPTVTTTLPTVTTISPTFTTTLPTVTTRSPTVTTASPTVTTRSSTVTTASPTVTTRSPSVTTASPTFSTRSPKVTTASPAVKTIQPTITSRSSTVTPALPTVTTRSPTVTTAFPTVTTRSPTVTTVSPTVTTRSPKVATTFPTVTTISPTATIVTTTTAASTTTISLNGCTRNRPTITMDEDIVESDLLKIECVSYGLGIDGVLWNIVLMEKKPNTTSFTESPLIADVQTGPDNQGCQNISKSFEIKTSRGWNNTEFKCITSDNQQSETKRLIITGADFGIKVHFKKKTFTTEMKDTKSKEFRDFATQFEDEMFNMLHATEAGANLKAVKVLSLKNGSITVEAVLIFKTTTRVIIDDSNNVVTTDWTSVDILHEMQVIITTTQNYGSHNFPLLTEVDISVDINIDIINEETYDKYECQESKTDIVFVLDTSISVGAANYLKMKAFVANFTGNVLIRKDAALMGLVSFNNYATTEFTLDDFQSPSQVIVAVNNIAYTGGGTNIADALSYVDENSFAFSANSRSPGRQNSTKVLVLMTDGQSGGASIEAQTLLDKGVLIICIGIGAGVDNNQLLAIAGNETLVTHVDTFDALKTVVGLIQQSACDDDSLKPVAMV